MEKNSQKDFSKSDESFAQQGNGQEVQNVPYPIYGHHYYNPQWVMYNPRAPALLYNNAVYFTISTDGTHYFHEDYQGQFYSSPEATTVTTQATSQPEKVQEDNTYTDTQAATKESSPPPPSLSPPPSSPAQEASATNTHHHREDYDWYNMWDQPQVLSNPYLNPWQRNNRPRKPFREPKNKQSRPIKDVRSTMVPMFPEAFALGPYSRWKK